MVKRCRGATRSHNSKSALTLVLLFLAIASQHRPAWSMIDGKVAIKEGRLHLQPNTDSATQVRLTDADGKVWALIGPFKPELERYAAAVQRAPIVIYFRTGSAQAVDVTRTCYSQGRLCTSTSKTIPTLVVEHYWLQAVDGESPSWGLLSQPSDGWLDIPDYDQRVRFPANEFAVQPFWKSLGCQAWILKAPQDRIGLCSPGPCVTTHLRRSGVLRCGPNPAEGPTLSRPAGLDWLACDAEIASTRWYCRLRDAHPVRKDLATSKVVNGGSLAIGSVLEPLLRQGTLLSPHLRFTLDWVDTPRCRKLALLNYPLDVKARGSWVGSVEPGRRSYDFDLGRDGGPSAWVVDPAGSRIVVTTDLSLSSRYGDARQYAPLTPPGYLEAVSGECALAVSNLELAFDSKAIQRELDLLQQHAMTAVDLLAARAVIHAQYLDASRGAICAVNRVANATLGAVEELSGQPVELDRLLAISPSAHMAISSALLEAQALGALPASASDPWQWFVASRFALDQQCAFSSLASGHPTEQAFAAFTGAIRDQGVANARAYRRDADKLKTLQTRAWALATAGGLQITSPDEQWMLLTL